jgi:hypothetical protein
MHRVQQKQNGFTIAELLVAAAITTGIVLMLGMMFGSLTRTAAHSNARIDAFRDARAAVQIMERDLTGIVQASNAAFFALDDRYNDPNTGAQKNQQMYAIVSAKNSGTGDLCAVGYYCRWDDSQHAYSLRRYFRNSNELIAQSSYFTSYKPSRTVPTWNILVNGVSNYMRSDHLYQPNDTDDIAKNEIKDEVLASYVWNFRLTAYKSDGTVDTTYPLIMDPSSPAAQLPAVIEISFNAISPEAARTITATNPSATDWMNPTSPKHHLLDSHTYEFRTRISL